MTVPDTPLATRTIVALCAVELVALGALAVPATVALALKVRSIDSGMTHEETLGLVLGIGAVAAMVSNPVFGWWSDRTGRRSRWMLGGVVAGAGAAFAVVAVDSTLWLLVTWCAMQVAYNATFASLYGLIADLIPEADRARVSSLFAASATGSVVVSLGLVSLLPTWQPLLFLLMPSAGLVVASIAARHLARMEGAPGVRGPAAGWGVLLRGGRDYWWVWTQRLVTQFAHSTVLMFGLYFLIRRVGMSEDPAADWVAGAAAASALLSMVAAVAAGRFAARAASYGPLLAGGIGLIAVALVVKAFGTSLSAYLVATLLVGIGIGCYYAVDLALVLRTVPADHAGVFLGWFNVARTLPQSLAPLGAPLVLGLGSGDVVGVDRSQNYMALYLGGLLVAAVALMLLRPITVLRRPVAVPA